ncbi:MAG: helix-turn-helix domain-containing protein [Ignavibacteria bacterium]|nr:helix-turn-helix domain-containing protein [Ignavibacteria bacterium]
MTKENTAQISKFVEFGLTEREAKVYLILLNKKSFTASEIQNSVDITRTKIYEILQKMVARGICVERYAGKKKFYEAVEPKTAFQRVFEKYNEECRNEYEKRNKIKDELIKSLYPVYEKSKNYTSPLDFIEIMKDKDQIQNRYIRTLRESKTDFLTFNKGPYVCDTSDRLTEQVKEESNLIKRGVACKNIYESGELSGQDWLQEYLKKLIKLGQQAKVVKYLPIKMMVSDGKRVILPLQQNTRDGNGLTLLYIEHDGLATACKSYFYSLWEKSETVKFK